MRKSLWAELGIVGLSLVLLCGSTAAWAQQQAGTAAQRGEAELWRSVGRLQRDMAQLQAEVAELRAELAEQRGVGGAGTVGQAPVQAPAPAAGGSQGSAVVKAIFTGTLKEVGSKSIVLDDARGVPLVIAVDLDTRVYREGKRVPLSDLSEGTRVRASVDMLSGGRTEATEIVVQQ
ncbi:hypothetical protein P2318_33505 [Myxococcaceae bacterium GXIMD 01537]